MKKLTRILSLVVVAVIALVLAGCGKTTAKPEPQTTQKPAPTTTAAPRTTQAQQTTQAQTTTVKPVEYYENGLLKGNFENLAPKIQNLSNKFVANWANFSAGSAEIVTEGDGNHAIKLVPGANKEVAITGEFGPGMIQVGHFKVQARIKKGADFAGSIVFGGFDNSNWVPGYQVPFDLTEVELSETEWTLITAEYDVETATTNPWVNFDFGYNTTAETVSDNNFILVDDVTVLKKGEDDAYTKADTCANNSFEFFDAELILNVGGWKANSFIFVEGDSLENEILSLDGNTVLKVYGSAQDVVKFDLAAGTAIVLPGNYRVSMKVKAGSACGLDGISFLFFGDPRPALSVGEDPVAFDIKGVNADGWTTVYAYFTVSERVTSAWVNMYFMVKLNNAEAQSADNYILIDDVEICQEK